MAFNAQLNVKIPNDFTQGLNAFMANVQKFQARAQQFAQQTGPQQTQQHVQVQLSQFLIKLRRVAKFFERMSKILARIVERVASWLGTLGSTFLRYLATAIPAFLGSLGMMVPAIGWVFTAASWTISAGIFIGTTIFSGIRLGLKFAKWLWDKMVDLGDAVLQDWMQAAGTGATIGGVRALRTVFADMPLTAEALAGAARARFDATSKARRALILLKVKVTKDTADIVMEAIMAAREFMLTRPKGGELLAAKEAGLLEIFDPEMLIALTKMETKEIMEKRELFFRQKSILGITEAAVKWWKDFTIWVQEAGVNIVNAIAERLADPKTGFLDAVEKLSKAVVKFIEEVLKSPLGQKTIDTIIFYLEAFTKWLSSDKPYKLMEDMKTWLKKLMEKFEDINKEARELLDQLGIDYKPKEKGAPVPEVTPSGGIRWHRHPGSNRPGDRGQTTRFPSRRGAGPESAGPLPSTYPQGPPGTRYDPISATSIGGGVGGSSASMGAGRHQGVDLMAPRGSPVYATMDGEIVRFGTDNFGQPTVTIRNADGTYSRFLHMGKRFGKVGDKVRGGQQIGTSGVANGVPHLHYELWRGPPGSRGSQLLDPMKTHGWDRRRALPRGAEPARTNQRSGTQAPTPPPAPTPTPAPTPPTRAAPTPAPTPTPTPAPQRPAPAPTTPAPPTRQVPVPRARTAPAPAPSNAPHPSQPAPIPHPRPAPSNAPHPTQPIPTPRPSNAPVNTRPAAPTPTPRPAVPAPAVAPAPAPPAPSPARGPITNSVLAEQRREVMKEFNDPQVRAMMAYVVAHETEGRYDRTNVVESLVNRVVTDRALGKNASVRKYLTNGFYAPINDYKAAHKGALPTASGLVGDYAYKDVDAAVQDVGGGRNELGGRTDQGSATKSGKIMVKPAGRIRVRDPATGRLMEYYGYQNPAQRAMADKLQQQARSGRAVPATPQIPGPTKWREDRPTVSPLQPTRQPLVRPSNQPLPSLRDPTTRGPTESLTRRLRLDPFGDKTFKDPKGLDRDLPDSLVNVPSRPSQGASSSDLDFLASRGAHDTVTDPSRGVRLQNVPPGSKLQGVPSTDPEFAARLRTAIEAYEKETGKKARVGEMTRDIPTQSIYWERYHHDRSRVAPPGRSRHQQGDAVDTPDTDFLRWLNRGNNRKYGLRSGFLPNDPVHIQKDRTSKLKLYDPNKQAPAKPDPDEPQAKPEDPDLKPGDASKFLLKEFKKNEVIEDLKNDRQLTDPDETGRLHLAQADLGTKSDATPVLYNTRTGEKLPDPDPRELQKALEKVEPDSDLEWQIRKERALRDAGPGIPEWKDAHPPRDYGPGTGLPAPGEIQDELNDVGKVKKPETDVVPYYRDPRDIKPDWKFDPRTGRSLEQPIGYTRGSEDPSGDIKPGSAGNFLVQQQKALEQQRAAGDRSLEGMTQVAKYESKPIETAKGYDPEEKHIKDVKEGETFTGRLTPYAPGEGGPVEGGIETSHRLPHIPTRGEVNAVRSSKGEPPISQKDYEKTYQRAYTLDDVRHGNSEYVTIASHPDNYEQKFTINEITYRSPEDGKTYTLRNVKAIVHDKGSAFYKPHARPDKFDVAVSDFRGKSKEDLKKMNQEPWGQEDPREFKKGWNKDPTTVDGQEIKRASKGGIGSDTAAQAKADRDAGNTPDVRHPEARERVPDTRPYTRTKGYTPSERRHSPIDKADIERSRRRLENRSDGDVTEGKNPDSSSEQDASPSAPPMGNGGGGGNLPLEL